MNTAERQSESKTLSTTGTNSQYCSRSTINYRRAFLVFHEMYTIRGGGTRIIFLGGGDPEAIYSVCLILKSVI